MDPFLVGTSKWLEFIRSPVLVEPAHALCLERSWRISIVDHERLVSRFEQRDDRIAANPQAHDRTVDGPPARKSKRTVRAAGCVQHHERTVEPTRSEEHTSELQSQSNLVCR